jgi:hypothetical protein
MECDDLTAEMSGDTQLTTCVRCPGLSNIDEEFLYYRRLIITTARKIKIKYVCFFNAEGLNWVYCCWLCPDGAPAMFGAGQGVFLARVKEVNSQVKIFHYLFLREMLASRRL